MSLPITHPALIFAAAMGIFLVAPQVMQVLRLPGIIGVILAGALLGPNGLNVLARDQTIILLGTVGLLWLMFMAGVEIDLHGFRKHRNRSLGFGALTFLLPQGIGTAVMRAIGYDWPTSILIASMFASHTLVAYPIALRLGIGKTGAVTTAVGGTIITDTAALLVLAVVASSTSGDLDGAFWVRLGACLGVYSLVLWLGLPRLARWFFRNERTGNEAEFAFVLTALFLGAFLAEVAGVEAIVGAFFVGLALNRLLPAQSPLTNRVRFAGEALFIPFFLLSIGMLVDVRVFAASPQAWIVIGGMVGTVVVTKWLAAFAAGAAFGYSRAESWVVFGLSVPQAAATLAATLVGIRIGLFDDAVLNGAIAMIVVTVILGPWAVARHGRTLALAEEERPYEASDAPERILVPVGHPDSVQPLLSLALLLRNERSDEPIFPITVVPDDDSRAPEYVATAEKLLDHAVDFAAGADVRVVPLTRVDHNFASGIARGAREARASVIVVGWDGRRTRRFSVFGSVLDQVLAMTRQELLVSRLTIPLNTVSRVVLVVTPAAERMAGFADAVVSIKRLAWRLRAGIHVVAVADDPDRWRFRLADVRPQVPVTSESEREWDRVPARLRQLARPLDLGVLLSAREGTIAAHPALRELPAALADLFPGGFLVVYPSEPAPPGRSFPAPVPEN